MTVIFHVFALLSFIICFGQPDKRNIQQTPNELVADNGKLTVKFDLTRGGAISWISYSGSHRSFVNIADDDGLGMLVYNPKCTEFLAGMAGEPGKESSDASTSYIAPIRDEILYKDAIYEYEYYILIGSLEEMRKQVYEIRKNLKISGY